ncbi:MAG: ABC transporter ATP-binding protein [Neomegalonema sp.]|nr:ABC transporter ATP-binding protein [Neomegalonema sp.]
MPLIEIQNVSKTYVGGHQALDDVSLDIEKGEILALLGPNGAGKTTLINIVCGLVTHTDGRILLDGRDVTAEYRQTRRDIGLVPQEMPLDPFDKLIDNVAFSRRLFGLPHAPDRIEAILRDLSLWDKRDNRLLTLSGGMKRRVLIAKALAHEPKVLFLDEPTAGVDVELRRSTWDVVRRLRDSGVTVILTTHYLEEAEEIADRVAVIDKGRIQLVQDKDVMMRSLGAKKLIVELQAPIERLSDDLAARGFELEPCGARAVVSYDPSEADGLAAAALAAFAAAGVAVRDISTEQSTLEEIFVGLIGDANKGASS